MFGPPENNICCREYQTVTMDMQIKFDNSDGSIVLKKSRDANYAEWVGVPFFVFTDSSLK